VNDFFSNNDVFVNAFFSNNDFFVNAFYPDCQGFWVDPYSMNIAPLWRAILRKGKDQ